MSRKDPFPGTLVRIWRSYQLTDEQVAWLRRWYVKKTPPEIAAEMGVAPNTARRMIRANGLVLTPAQKAHLEKRHADKVRRTCIRNGSYASLRNKTLSAAAHEGARRYWQEVRDGVRESPWQIMRRENPRRYNRIRKAMRQSLIEKWKRAKRNYIYCIHDDSRLRIVFNAYTSVQRSVKWEASRLGYWWAEDLSDEGGFRYNIYYDDDTQRNERLEARLARHGFRVIDSRPHEE